MQEEIFAWRKLRLLRRPIFLQKEYLRRKIAFSLAIDLRQVAPRDKPFRALQFGLEELPSLVPIEPDDRRGPSFAAFATTRIAKSVKNASKAKSARNASMAKSIKRATKRHDDRHALAMRGMIRRAALIAPPPPPARAPSPP